MPYYDFWRDKQVTGPGRWLSQMAARHTFERITRAAPGFQQVAEIGPGRGAFAELCLSHELSYTAIDVNIGLLQGLGGDRNVCSFVPPLPLREASFDVVVASHVLEHASGLPQAQAMVAEMRRVVRPDGCVVIISPDLLWVRNYFWDCDYSHNFPISARRAQQLFLDTGLRVVKLEHVYNHLTGPDGWLLGSLIGRAPYCLPGAQPTSRFYSDRVYKIRMTFSRAVLIIGRRPKEDR